MPLGSLLLSAFGKQPEIFSELASLIRITISIKQLCDDLTDYMEDYEERTRTPVTAIIHK